MFRQQELQSVQGRGRLLLEVSEKKLISFYFGVYTVYIVIAKQQNIDAIPRK